MGMIRLVVAGLGYAGARAAALAAARGWQVTGTMRDPAGRAAPPGVALAPFAGLPALLEQATHLLVTAPPGEDGDPVVAHAARAPGLRHVAYLSTTGVYGDRAGGWVEEDAAPAPTAERSRRRRAAEQQWEGLAGRIAVDLCRVAGIYGPGRAVTDDLRAGTARMILAPGHAFGRIHVEDIARAAVAALAQGAPPGVRVFHFADDLPAPQSDVVAFAARLLGMEPPPGRTLEQAWPEMSAMARSFWAENRRVASARTQAVLGLWRYPTYRQGLRATACAGP
jgi:nucleoside-diphosphate-sugar epimerase